MQHLPIFLSIRDQACVVIGGGKLASRKVALLLRAGAHVRVIAPELCIELVDHLDGGRIEHLSRGYREADLDDALLVFAASDDDQLNRRVARAARHRSIPVNVVDQPAESSFVLPSIVDRSPVVIAVSSGGTSPILARLLRARLESLIPDSYGTLAELAKRFHERVRQRFAAPTERRRFWSQTLQGNIAERVFSGQLREAEGLLEQALASENIQSDMGEVYLVGGGPGDPDLLTFRALRLMQQADVVVYDRLVAKAILAMTNKDAERIYVGKARDNHAMRQEEISQLLADLAKQGKRVLRLKGGDPFIFGRGGEEIDTLACQGVPFQVVPGITAAAGCASYAGIPLTHRDYAQSVIFVTGHLKDNTVDLNWAQLVQPKQTVVFYMGLHGLPVISRLLQAHGMSSETPAALIQQGTTHRQRVISGTIASLPEQVERERPKPPTLIIVGEVVGLQHRLAWYKAPGTSDQTAALRQSQDKPDPL